METRAPFVIIGAFVLAAIVAVFGFVYWLNNTAGLGARATYHVQFDGPVPGLLVGAAVLFNGIRVGEVTSLVSRPITRVTSRQRFRSLQRPRSGLTPKWAWSFRG